MSRSDGSVVLRPAMTVRDRRRSRFRSASGPPGTAPDQTPGPGRAATAASRMRTLKRVATDRSSRDRQPSVSRPASGGGRRVRALLVWVTRAWDVAQFAAHPHPGQCAAGPAAAVVDAGDFLDPVRDSAGEQRRPHPHGVHGAVTRRYLESLRLVPGRAPGVLRVPAGCVVDAVTFRCPSRRRAVFSGLALVGFLDHPVFELGGVQFHERFEGDGWV